MLAEYERVWPWLEKAAGRYGNTHTKESVLARLLDGRAQLWTERNAALITSIERYDTGMVEVRGWLGAGKPGRSLTDLRKIEKRVELRAASTGSGGNADNATRQNLRRLLENPRGFTPDEQKALSAIVRGTPVQNAARLAGKFAPTGVVSGVLSGGAGYGLLGPAGPLLPLAGMGAKAAADKMTQSNVGLLSEIIAAGGTKAATQAAKTPTQAMIEGQSGNLARLLSGLGLPLIVDH